MFARSIAAFSLLLAIAGCSTSPPVAPTASTLWHDELFPSAPNWVVESQSTVFALDAGIAAELRAVDLPSTDSRRRLQLLLSKIYEAKGIRLSYVGGNTTVAADTWRNLQGDCLSLTIMAYSAARYLNIPAHMQEVEVPLTIERRDGTEFVNGHVNVYIPTGANFTAAQQGYNTRGMVIDFEPQYDANRLGQILTEPEALARFYNNRAAQSMARHDDKRAYSYFRAAIGADPRYAPAYVNLAQLYLKHGALAQPAEQLLRHAIALDGPSYTPLRSMVQLLQSQGRNDEARQYVDQLKKRESEDPYYWLALGLDAMRAEHFDAAIRYLKRSAELTNGFEEVHRNLSVAYLRTGQTQAAKKQLEILAKINSDSPWLAKLSKKIRSVESSPEMH